jgi:hypothetical protein
MKEMGEHREVAGRRTKTSRKQKKALLEAEGQTVIQKGKRRLVADYEKNSPA